MKLRMGINSKMLLTILSAVLLIYAVSIGYVIVNSRDMAKEEAMNLTDTYAEKYANLSITIMDPYMIAVRNLKQVFETFETIPEQHRRPVFRNMMRKMLKDNEDFIAVWSTWEPNSIDNLDTLYEYSPGSTALGNFTDMFYKNNGEIVFFDEVETDINEVFNKDYYQIPKKTLQETVLDPYYYSYTREEEDEILETSIVVPIVKDGQFLGVVGIDVPLTEYQKIIKQIQPFEENSAYLIANDGSFVAHPNPSYKGKKIADLYIEFNEKHRIVEKIKQGISFSFFDINPETGKQAYFSFVPINIGKSTTPWSLGISVPMEIMMKKANRNFYISIFMGILGLILLTLVIYFIARNISRPISITTSLLKKLSLGDIEDVEKLQIKSHDEIGNMSNSVNTLIEGLNSTAEFANQIGKGNLDAEFTPLSDDDVLGNALIEMRKSLADARKEEEKRKIEDKKQNWTTSGLAKFGDILRHNNDNLDNLSFNIISNLVDYLEANQGALFIKEYEVTEGSEDQDKVFFELKSAIAWGRDKFIKKKVEVGEDLVGRCAHEKKTIYLTEVPEDYVEITSGMGSSNPRSVLIVQIGRAHV